jgi:hypothetical protein
LVRRLIRIIQVQREMERVTLTVLVVLVSGGPVTGAPYGFFSERQVGFVRAYANYNNEGILAYGPYRTNESLF